MPTIGRGHVDLLVDVVDLAVAATLVAIVLLVCAAEKIPTSSGPMRPGNGGYERQTTLS